MKWSNILAAVIAFITAFLLPIIFAKLKKESGNKVKNYSQKLREIGIDFEEIKKGDERIDFIKQMSWGQKAEGIVALEKRNIDYLFLISVNSQYGVNYFLEFIVKNTFNLREGPIKKTYLKVKKDFFKEGSPKDIFWKGDSYLSQQLNMDYELKYKLLQTSLRESKMKLKIIPEKKYGYTRIKTNFTAPSQDSISFIDSIAGHIKTGL